MTIREFYMLALKYGFLAPSEYVEEWENRGIV